MQFNELDQLLKVEGVDGGFSDAAVLYTAYLDAQKIAGYAWPLNQRQRWNARPANCKRNYSKTKYHKK